MTPEKHCDYRGDREDALIAYLYDDANPIEKASFSAHLKTCARCREEVDELRGVRARLAQWSPPAMPWEAETSGARRSWWRTIPAWAQAAAAVLVVGAALGAANVDVRYDKDGLSVRTGWMRPAPAPAPAPVTVASSLPTVASSSPWSGDMAALEQRLRADIRSAPARTDDDQVMRRVRALLADSERKEENNLALRVAGLARDYQSQRSADLVRISNAIGAVQNAQNVAQSATASELMKNRNSINYLATLASQKQPQ